MTHQNPPSPDVKLSVITPLYNAGEMFDKFMTSLLDQTLKEIEIIIVNDGSTDGSDIRAQHYADSYHNIRVIHQQNGGVSRARNAGMAIAQGRYVTFPDADDTLYPKLYQTLMEMAEKDNLDVAQCNAERYFLGSQRIKTLIPIDRLSSTEILDGPTWLHKALSTKRYLHVVWLGIYRHDLIKQCGLSFEPGLHHQDIPWTTELMFNAARVRYTQEVLYRYYIHDQSISNRTRTGIKNVEYQRHYIRIAQLLENINQRYCTKIKMYPEFRIQVTHEALSICHSIRREPDPVARQMMLNDIFSSGTHKRMMRNARGVRQWYQLLLWLRRIYVWRKR
ncbi:glycosyltransferase [Biostraticola tofi]|uniref:Heptose III glucuronosyltransferase n=1 Tax=Biostraticola tofi TaxID=466109 RepID=A0A4R3YMJ5_9GAMM|nr:glycosyltransferase [Biostraticola tofi]TCV93501.1 heptose III glucuronosyltransferase [Biostraticola tofi]